MKKKTALVWFRQDLRLLDNPAFLEACSKNERIIALYILDKQISPLGSAQSWWLHHSLISLSASLEKMGLNLLLRQGNPIEIIPQLAQELSVDSVYWNHCYEPLAIQRDVKVKSILVHQGTLVKCSNGNLFNEPWNIKNKSGNYFKVFTPFWKHSIQTMMAPNKITIFNTPKTVSAASERLGDWNLLPKNPNWAVGFAQYWQPGEAGAQKKLTEFIAIDAAPYFRIFNPILQSKKFDPLGIYIKQWIPELAKVNSQLIHEPWNGGIKYYKPIVDHDVARKAALHYYQLIKK